MKRTDAPFKSTGFVYLVGKGMENHAERAELSQLRSVQSSQCPVNPLDDIRFMNWVQTGSVKLGAPQQDCLVHLRIWEVGVRHNLVHPT